MAGEQDGGGAGRQPSRPSNCCLAIVGLLTLLVPLPASADDAGASSCSMAATDLAHLQDGLARAQQEIAALRATGAEMQRSLETRDAALSDLRAQTTALLAAAESRSERLAAERDEALTHVAALQRQLREAGSVGTDLPGEAATVAVDLAVMKAQPAPLPAAKPPAALATTLDAAISADGSLTSKLTPAQVMSIGLADLSGVEVAEDGRLILSGTALFAPGQARLSAGGQEQLQTVAHRLVAALAQLPATSSWVLHVDGHTDNTPVRQSGFGSNQALSQARARAVAELLTAGGISAERLVATGLAATRPLAIGETEAARSRNRRIELWLSPS